MAAWTPMEREARFQETLEKMSSIFKADPDHAVRSQEFIKTFHNFIADDLRAFLHPKSVNGGIKVIEEAKVFGSFKSKDVDVAVIHPINGPLILVGVRSQMSSVGKNVLTYYQDIIGEAVSLQQRFPMATFGYAYLHPLEVVPFQKKSGAWTKAEHPRHARHARMYESIGYRDDRLYKNMEGSYDHFAHAIADFQVNPVQLRDDIVRDAVPGLDMSILTFVPRLVETFHSRNLWVQDIFWPTGREEFSGDSGEGDSGLDDALLEDADD